MVSQNRLAIIDLVTGDPPITNEDGSVAVVLNGEIYNFRELRDELRASGHEFRSRGRHRGDRPPGGGARRPSSSRAGSTGCSPSRSGTSAARGSCSAATASARSRSTTGTGDGGLVFGSEIKAVLADPGVPRRLDPGAIPAYLTFGYVPTPRTFFDGIRSLPAGHVLTLRAGRRAARRALLGAAARGGGLARAARASILEAAAARCATLPVEARSSAG